MRRSGVRGLIAVSALVVISSTANSGAIVGGGSADPGEYPSMALVYRADPNGPIPLVRGPVCGGTLVAPDIVVSGLHCTVDLVDPLLSGLPADPLGLGLNVMLGENAIDGTGGERIRVKALHQSGIPDSDVIVLELYEESVQPVLPWAGPEDSGLYPPGSPATIAGWGSLEDTNLGLPGTLIDFYTGGFPNELQEAEVPIVSDAACAAAYGSEFVAGTMVCAGYDEGGVDTCQGDSGGPLMTEVSEGEFLLIGTTWFGDGCARPGKPGVYSEIAPVSDFIASLVG